MVSEAIESVRAVAKEARHVLQSEGLYGPEVVDDFTRSLVAIFGGPSPS